MTFDKSKVCVAGLHEVKEGTKGWFADSVDELEDKVIRNSVNRTNGCLAKMKGQRDRLYVDEVNTVWWFFYPAPEKKYRPYETLEEMYSLLGKVIVERDGTKRCIITGVEKWCNNLYIDSMNVLRAFNDYTMEDGTPVGVEI